MLFGGNWNESSNSGSGCANWNNAPSNSNNNIGVRGVGDDSNQYTLWCGYGAPGRPCIKWSARLSCFGEHKQRSGKARSSETSKRAPGMKRHRNLMARIASIENLRDAYRKTSKGKRRSLGYLMFREYDELNLLRLREELLDSGYRVGQYRHFTIFEPKPRNIMALEFKDRLVQHALINIIGPIFDAGFLPYSFACRTGYGTHAGVKHVQGAMRRTGATHYLKTDFRKYFPSISREVLHGLIERKVACRSTLDLLREIVPVGGCGVPIGSLTSQIAANIYSNPLDYMIHGGVRPLAWARYMDDVVVLGDSVVYLKRAFDRIKVFASESLRLDISRWHIAPVASGVNFLGYRIFPDYKLLRKSSVQAAKRKIGNAIHAGDKETLRRFLASWSGHASWADSHNLITWMENRYDITDYQLAC